MKIAKTAATISMLALILSPGLARAGKQLAPLSELRGGDRVRVFSPEQCVDRFEATVESVRGNEIVLAPGRLGSSSAVIAAGDITRLEVLQGTSSKILRGMRKGFLMSASVGVLLGALYASGDAAVPVEIVLGTSLVLGTMGMAAGGLLGGIFGGDSWKPIDTRAVNLGLMPDRTPGLVFALDF